MAKVYKTKEGYGDFSAMGAGFAKLTKLKDASQDQLKDLFERKHPYIEYVEETENEPTAREAKKTKNVEQEPPTKP